MGPSVFAWFVAGFLVVLGVLLLLAAFKGGWAADQEGTLRNGDRSAGSRWGWCSMPASSNGSLHPRIPIMFALVARGFGSRQILRDAGIGFALAIVSYVGFDRILGYKIGSGLIESLI